MNIFDTIAMKKPEFTRTDRQVYDVISKDYTVVFHESSNSLARKTGLSQASIMRFCRRLGYSGYNDFRLALYGALQTGSNNNSDPSTMTLTDCFKVVLDELQTQKDGGLYDQFVYELSHASMVFTCGSHRSSLPAQLLNLEMRLSDIWSVFLPDDQTGGWPTGMTRKDVYVLFSESNSSHLNACEVMNALPIENRPTMYLISMNPKHPLRKYFDHVIRLPWPSHEDLPRLVDPSTVFMLFTDIVVSMILEKKEKNNEDTGNHQ